jgi:hypothetical protein
MRNIAGQPVFRKRQTSKPARMRQTTTSLSRMRRSASTRSEPRHLPECRSSSFHLGGEQEGAVEGFISERGLARRSEMYDRASFERATSASKQAPRIAISQPYFLALPAFLDGSGMSAIVPRPLADSFARTNPISIHELPNTACVPCTFQPREVALPTLEEIN